MQKIAHGYYPLSFWGNFIFGLICVLLQVRSSADLVKVAVWNPAQANLQFVEGLTNATAIASGNAHWLALREDGTVQAGGENYYGKTKVPESLTQVVAIGAGYDHSLAIKADGTSVAWGRNDYLQCKIPIEATNLVSIKGGSYHTLALRADGTVCVWGANNRGQTQVPAGLAGVMTIAAGGEHNLALRSNGTVVAWGRNDAGQTNVPGDLTNVVAIAAGDYHSLALKNDGYLVGWGATSLRRLYRVPYESNVVAIAAAGNHCLALKADRTVVAWGDNLAFDAVAAVNTNAIAISTGHNLNLALIAISPHIENLANQRNYTGKSLMLAPLVYGDQPMSYQWQFNDANLEGATNRDLALGLLETSESGIYCLTASNVWGISRSQVRLEVVDSAPLILVPPAAQDVQVFFQEARMKPVVDGSWPLSYQWRFQGEDISGATDPELVIPRPGFEHAGSYSLVASNRYGVTESSAVPLVLTPLVGWGANANGQTNVPRRLHDPVAIACGSDFNVVLKGDGTVTIWGHNTSNYLGLVPGPTNTPAELTNAIAIAAGADFSLALKADGTVIAWGVNNYGQTNVPMGLSNVVEIAAGQHFGMALLADGAITGWGSFPNPNRIVDSLTNVVSIEANLNAAFALRRDGTIVQWGTSMIQGLETASGLVSIACGGYNCLGLSRDGRVVDWRKYYGNYQAPANLSNVVTLAAGDNFSLALTAEGKVIGWGENKSGQLNPPLIIGYPRFLMLTNVVSLSAGTAHSMALLRKDNLPSILSVVARSNSMGMPSYLLVSAFGLPRYSYQWRCNGRDISDATNRILWLRDAPEIEPGDFSVVVSNSLSSTTSSNLPLPRLQQEPWITVQPTNCTGYALTSQALFNVRADGAWPLSYQWYHNGIPIPQATNATLQLTSLKPSQTGDYSAVVSNRFGVMSTSNANLRVGPVVAWGADEGGQCHPPFEYLDLTNISAGASHVLGLKPDGTVVAWGDNSAGQTKVPSDLGGVECVSAGGFHSLALKKDGTVVAWGSNDNGQCQLPVDLTNVIAISAGAYHSLALRKDGTVVAWGDNSYAQCAIPEGLTNVGAISANGYFSLALKRDGTVAAWGDNQFGQTQVPADLGRVVAVAAGAYHVLALKADGTMRGWGRNENGQASVPIGLSNVTAITAGGFHNVAMKEDSTVVAWGLNQNGQAQAPTGLTNVCALVAGGYFSAALVRDSVPPILTPFTDQTQYSGKDTTLRVLVTGARPMTYQWRREGQDILGATNTYLNLGSVRTVDTGCYSVVVSNAAGWAISPNMVLTVVDKEPQVLTSPAGQVVRAYADGARFEVVADGSWPLSYQWRHDGKNIVGETNSVLEWSNVSPSQRGQYDVVVRNRYGMNTSSAGVLTITPVLVWGNSYYQWTIPAEVTNVTAVAAGSTHTLALRADGTVVAFGDNSAGQTNVPSGLSEVVALTAGGFHSLVLKKDGTMVAWGSDDKGQCRILEGLTNVVAVAAGVDHNLALRKDGTVVAWGDNACGQCDVPIGLMNVRAISANGYFNLALKWDGQVVAWGNNDYGQTQVPADLRQVVAVAAGTYHALALKADGTLRAWGRDDFYGQGSIPLGLSDVTAITAGGFHNLAIKGDGTVVVWGYTPDAQAFVPRGLTNVCAIAAGGYFNVALVRETDIPQLAPLVDQTQCSGQAITLRVNATGAQPMTYQWRREGEDIPGATNEFLILDSLRTEDTGHYSVVVSNTFGWTLSSNMVLTVVERAPQILISPVSQVVRAYMDQVRLEVAADGSWPLDYQWRCDDVDIPGATNSFLEWSRVGLSQTGQYEVVVSNRYGAVRTAPARLLVSPLLVLGANSYGQYVVPAELTNIQAFAAGINHSVALKSDGTVVVWGDNAYGQTAVPGNLGPAQAVSAGGNHSLAVRLDGQVMAWGNNDYGQTIVPVNLANVIGVAAGGAHSLALKVDGRVVAWGNNEYRQCAVPANLSNVVALAAGVYFSVALRQEGTVAAWGNNEYGQSDVPGDLTKVVAMAAGNEHVLALRADGTVTAWGQNTFGQATVPEGLSNAVAVAAGGNISMALRADGTVVAWGHNAYGQGQIPSDLTNAWGLAVGGFHTLIGLRPDQKPLVLRMVNQTQYSGKTACFYATGLGAYPLWYQWQHNGENILGATNVALSIGSVNLTDTGYYSVIITNEFGWTISSNTYLRVVDNKPEVWLPNTNFMARAYIDRVQITAVADGSWPLSCQWKHNGTNVPGATNSNLVFAGARLEEQGQYSLVVANAFGLVESPMAILSVNPVIAWGEGGAAPMGSLEMVALAAGSYHMLALNCDGSVVAWGDNSVGQGNVPWDLDGAVAVSAGSYHSLALKKDGTVRVWGGNDHGQLNAPTGLTNLIAIASGGFHNLALRCDGRVVAWGDNSFAQCNIPSGLGQVQAIAAGGYHSMALRSDGRVVVWGTGGNGPINGHDVALIPADLNNAVAIAAGGYHCLALKADGGMAAWGNNSFGQCSVPIGLSNVTAIVAGGHHSLAMKSDGTAVAWGLNDMSQSQVPDGLTNGFALAAGGNFSVILVRKSPVPLVSQLTRQIQYSGKMITLGVLANGAVPLNYQWFWRGQPVLGMTNSMLALTDVRTNQAGEYWVEITNHLGRTASPVVNLRVTPLRLQADHGQIWLHLDFATLSNCHYQVEQASSLDFPVWSVLTNLAGTGDSLSLELPQNAESQFYRVQEK